VRLVLADGSLVVQGRSYEGFPLLIGKDGESVEPAQTFLWDELATNGRSQSLLTWAKYGRDLYDYFAFLEANHLEWNDMPVRGMPGNLDRYRDWSKIDVGLQGRTINARLRLIARFYRWAHGDGLIDSVPFRTSTVRPKAGERPTAPRRLCVTQLSSRRPMLRADSLPALVEVASALAHQGRFLDAGDCREVRTRPLAGPFHDRFAREVLRFC
jgi:hypothetical protein